MKVSDFNYELPKELIAQHPYDKRDEARLMVLNKENKTLEHKIFTDVLDYLNSGDCLVINNTKVIPARLYGKKDTGANIEFLLLKKLKEADTWEVMVRPGSKLKIGTKVIFGDGILKAEILEMMEGGNRKVVFKYEGIFNEILDRIGLMPLPPYITRPKYDNYSNVSNPENSLKEIEEDKEKYQTVYAKYNGSAAAPTAGLHFTEELLEKIKRKGIVIANVTLHVGIGTFRPIKVENIEEHNMHSEHYYIRAEDAQKINRAKRDRKKIISVGTTSCRVLESVSDKDGYVREIEGDTSIFIYPGYKFKCIDSLITNFHLPESSLIMLVSSLAGKDFVMEAYNEGIKEKYKFFSFGDAMIIM